MRKARKIWTRMTRILVREGSDPSISGLFFNAVVQEVLLFGSETWILTPHIERALGSFQQRVVRRISGRQPSWRGKGRWGYPPLASAMEEAGFEEIRVYITRRQNTVAQYIATRPILDLCERSVRRLGAWVYQRWWNQEGLYLEEERERAEAESDRKEEKCGEGAAHEETTGRS